MTAKACTCRTKRSTVEVDVAPCGWHKAYRKARRGPRLGPDEVSRIRREAWARKLSAPRGTP